MSSATVTWRRRLAADDGFTLMELLVAVTILAVGLTAIIGSIDRSTQLTLGAQAREQMSAYGQRELERLRTIPYADLGLVSLPAASGSGLSPDDGEQGNPRSPNFYVNGTRFRVKSDYANSASAPPPGVPSTGEEMNTPGQVAAGPEAVSVGQIKILVYRYVTWRDDPGCANCAGDQDTKRVTVAVAPADATSREARSVRPLYFSTVVTPK